MPEDIEARVSRLHDKLENPDLTDRQRSSLERQLQLLTQEQQSE